MSGPSQPAVTTQISKTELPDFINNGGQANLDFANQVSNNLKPAYSGNMVAGLNANENAAFNMAGMTNAVGQPWMQNALGSLSGLQGFTPQSVGAASAQAPASITAQQINPTSATAQNAGWDAVSSRDIGAQNAGWDAVSSRDIGYDRVRAMGVGAQNTRAGNWLNTNQSGYMNPYTQQVIDSSMAVLNQQGKQALNGIGDNAAMAGAFGGSRQGVAEGTQAAQSALLGAQMNAQLQDQNFRQAQAQFNTDSDRSLTSDTNNANRNLQAATTNASNFLNAGLANQSTRLQADTGNAQRALQAALANQQTGYTANAANADRLFNADNANANRALQAGLANQQTGYTANAANADRAYTADRDNANRFLTAAQANQSADLTAQGQNANYAFQTANNNADRALTADRSNQTAGLTGAQLNTDAAYRSLMGGQMATQSWLQGASALQAAGDSQRAYAQDLLNQDAARYDATRNADLEKLGIKQSALSLTPYGQTTTQTTTQPQQKSNGFLSGLGAIGSIAGSIAPLFMMSDEDTKKNKRKLGIVDPATGADLYSYSYKGEDTPRIGPMAGDLEKKVPGSVIKGADGFKRIHPATSNTPVQEGLRAATGAKGPKVVGLLADEGGASKYKLTKPTPGATKAVFGKTSATPPAKGKKLLTKKRA